MKHNHRKHMKLKFTQCLNTTAENIITQRVQTMGKLQFEKLSVLTMHQTKRVGKGGGGEHFILSIAKKIVIKFYIKVFCIQFSCAIHNEAWVCSSIGKSLGMCRAKCESFWLYLN